MKKFFVLAAVAMMAAMSVQAQEEEVVNAYFTQDDMPDMMVFLPGPPVQQSSIAPMTTIDSSAYTLQGTHATATTRGIIIQKQRKMVRK